MMSNVGDWEDMAENAKFVLQDDKKLSQFKDKAYKRAQSFDLKSILPMYIEVYEEAIESCMNKV